MRNFFGFLLLGGALGWGEKERVRLEDVQVVTLTRGAITTGRRSSPVPQLACVGGSGRGEEQPKRVQCNNRGSDGRGVQWECKADMDKHFGLAKWKLSARALTALMTHTSWQEAVGLNILLS